MKVSDQKGRITLRLLLLEADERYATSIEDELREVDYAVQSLRVESLADLERALQFGAPDLVVMSDSIPGLEVSQVSAALSDAEMDLPIIVTTNRIQEKRLESYLLDGASSVVGRTHMVHLQFAVARALGRVSELRNFLAESKRAAEQAQKSDKTISLAGAEASASREERVFARILEALEREQTALAMQNISELTGSHGDDHGEKKDVSLRILDSEGRSLLGQILTEKQQLAMPTEVDRDVLRRVLEIQRDWLADKRRVLTFIRLSTRTLEETEILDWLKQERELRNFEPALLSFEARESDIVDDLELYRPCLKALHEFGCRVTVSHFGRHHKSLNLLDALDIDYVKLDMMMTRDLWRGGAAVSLVEDAVEAAHAKEVEVIASHIENAAVMAELWKFKVDFVQGYYVKEPEIAIDYDERQAVGAY